MIEARRRASHDKFSDRQSLPGLSLRYGLLRGAGPEKAGLPEDLFARQAPCLGAEEYFRFLQAIEALSPDKDAPVRLAFSAWTGASVSKSRQPGV